MNGRSSLQAELPQSAMSGHSKNKWQKARRDPLPSLPLFNIARSLVVNKPLWPAFTAFIVLLIKRRNLLICYSHY